MDRTSEYQIPDFPEPTDHTAADVVEAPQESDIVHAKGPEGEYIPLSKEDAEAYAEMGAPVSPPPEEDGSVDLAPLTAEDIAAFILEEDQNIDKLKELIKERQENRAGWVRRLRQIVKTGEYVEIEDNLGMPRAYAVVRSAKFKRRGKGGPITDEQEAVLTAAGIPVNKTVNIAKVGKIIRTECPTVDETLELEQVRVKFGDEVLDIIEINHEEKVAEVDMGETAALKAYNQADGEPEEEAKE